MTSAKKKRDRRTWTDLHFWWLDCGVELAGGDCWERQLANGVDPQLVEDDQRLCWSLHRSRLVAERVAARPGTRPWAWWRFDAESPRDRDRFEVEACQLAAMNVLTREEIRRLQENKDKGSLPKHHAAAGEFLNSNRKER